jgi:hypothetical protein
MWSISCESTTSDVRVTNKGVLWCGTISFRGSGLHLISSEVILSRWHYNDLNRRKVWSKCGPVRPLTSETTVTRPDPTRHNLEMRRTECLIGRLSFSGSWVYDFHSTPSYKLYWLTFHDFPHYIHGNFVTVLKTWRNCILPNIEPPFIIIFRSESELHNSAPEQVSLQKSPKFERLLIPFSTK